MRWTASDFERVDPRLFRSFLAVVKTQSFSSAATEAALTQGAISQQIAKLEDRLNTQLFVRAGGRVVLTAAGQLLAAHAQAYMDHTSRFLEELNEEFESLRGAVDYAMPESCIHAPHFGWLLQRRKEHPDLVLRIQLKPATEVLKDLLDGEIDFGFVNQPVDSAAVQSYPFCFEEYALVASARRDLPRMPTSLDALLELPMIVYPGVMHCMNRWIEVRYRERDPISAVALRIHGDFNDMRGALSMVEGDLGVTVLPRHVAASRVEGGALRIIDDATHDKMQPVTQQISIVRLKDRRMPARVKRVIRWFLDMHTELQPIPKEFLE